MIPFEFFRAFPIILAAIFQVIFVIIYASPWFGARGWWAHPIGRTIFIKALAMAVLLVSMCSVYLIRGSVGRYSEVAFDLEHTLANYEGFVVVAYYFVCFAVFYQLMSIVRERLAQRRKKSCPTSTKYTFPEE